MIDIEIVPLAEDLEAVERLYAYMDARPEQIHVLRVIASRMFGPDPEPILLDADNAQNNQPKGGQ